MAETYTDTTPRIGDGKRVLLAKELTLLRGGVGRIYQGNYGGAAPAFTPTGDAAIAFDTSDGSQWNWYDGAWN